MHESRGSALIAHLGHQPLPMLIDGQWTQGGGPAFAVSNPATGAVLCIVGGADAADVERVATTTRAAFLDGRWSRRRPEERSRALHRWADLVERDEELLAELETLQTGKPIRESRGDVARALDGIRFYAGAARQVRGETINVSESHHSYVESEPVGVVACIVPWNVPIVLAVSKAAPALAAGNCVIVKPSQSTPLTAMHLGRLWQEAELPDGVFSVVNGSGRTVGEALCLDPQVTMVTFTGSTDVGLRLGELTARQNKRIMLELGGKSPNIIMADADLSRAVPGAASAIFYGQGQICAAGSRLLLHEAIYEPFLAALVEHTEGIRIGDPLDASTDFGALASIEHRDDVLSWVHRAQADGARVVTGGQVAVVPGLPEGAFMQPTIITDVAPTDAIVCEEVFGPVLVVQRIRDAEEAIRIANDSMFGLSAGVWSADVALARRIARRLESGVVWINDYGKFHPAMPFGGVKLSGSAHREWSHLAMDAFVEHKAIWEWME